jgi:hypothetical protein
MAWYLLWAGFLALTPLSVWFLPVGALFLVASLYCALVAGVTAEPPFRITRAQRRRKTWLVATVHFLHPIVRTYGRVAARIRTVRWGHKLCAMRWMAPSRVLAEIPWLFHGSKEIRRYWGVGPQQREEVLRDVQRCLRSLGLSATFTNDWDNHDLELNGSLTTAGEIFSAPEHYDQSLCFGFRATTSGWAAAFLGVALVVVCAAAALLDPRAATLAAVPVVVLLGTLSGRARMRSRAWEAIQTVMVGRAAKRFGEDEVA